MSLNRVFHVINRGPYELDVEKLKESVKKETDFEALPTKDLPIKKCAGWHAEVLPQYEGESFFVSYAGHDKDSLDQLLDEKNRKILYNRIAKEHNIQFVDIPPDVFQSGYGIVANIEFWSAQHACQRTPDGEIVPLFDHSNADPEGIHFVKYLTFNQIYAEAINNLFEKEIITDDDAVISHDYHMYFTAEFMNQKIKKGLFLHIPIPPAEYWSKLPHKDAITQALVYFDSICVHTTQYEERLRTALGEKYFEKVGAILWNNLININFATYSRTIEQENVCQDLRDAVDDPSCGAHVFTMGGRGDASKGTLEKLKALKLYLDRHLQNNTIPKPDKTVSYLLQYKPTRGAHGLKLLSSDQQSDITNWIEQNRDSNNILLIQNKQNRRWSIYGKKGGTFLTNEDITNEQSVLPSLLNEIDVLQPDISKTLDILDAASVYLTGNCASPYTHYMVEAELLAQQLNQHQLVKKYNKQYPNKPWKPIRVLAKSLTKEEMIFMYQNGPRGNGGQIETPTADGCNLICHEFCAAYKPMMEKWLQEFYNHVKTTQLKQTTQQSTNTRNNDQIKEVFVAALKEYLELTDDDEVLNRLTDTNNFTTYYNSFNPTIRIPTLILSKNMGGAQRLGEFATNTIEYVTPETVLAAIDKCLEQNQQHAYNMLRLIRAVQHDNPAHEWCRKLIETTFEHAKNRTIYPEATQSDRVTHYPTTPKASTFFHLPENSPSEPRPPTEKKQPERTYAVLIP